MVTFIVKFPKVPSSVVEQTHNMFYKADRCLSVTSAHACATLRVIYCIALYSNVKLMEDMSYLGSFKIKVHIQHHYTAMKSHNNTVNYSVFVLQKKVTHYIMGYV